LQDIKEFIDYFEKKKLHEVNKWNYPLKKISLTEDNIDKIYKDKLSKNDFDYFFK